MTNPDHTQHTASRPVRFLAEWTEDIPWGHSFPHGELIEVEGRDLAVTRTAMRDFMFPERVWLAERRS